MAKKYLSLFFFLVMFSLPALSQLKVEVVTNHPDAIYAKNDSISFHIKVLSDGVPVNDSVNFIISNDGIASLKEGSLDLKDGTARVHWKQSAPMIVLCTVTYTSPEGDQVSGMAAAAVAPYEIKPTATLPPDFTEYWMTQKADLAEISMDPQLIPVPVDTSGIEVNSITLRNVDGSQVHGYFGKPKGEGPFPAVLHIPGAGVGSAALGYAQSMAAKGFLVMAISVHDLPNGQPKQFYKDQYSGPLKKYYLQGREELNTYYFRRVVLGCVRAIDYLTSLPEWDNKHMIVKGSSQGGGLTLMTTGLDSRVTAAAANVPALCDHSGRNFGRPSGWPQLAPLGLNGRLDPEILQVSRYYDAVNFAGRIKVPVIFGVGLIDHTCHPTTVFSAYNAIQSSRKRIVVSPLMGHAFDPAYNDLLAKFIMEEGGK